MGLGSDFIWLIFLVFFTVFVTYFYDLNKKNQINYLNKSLKMLKKAYAKEPESYFILDSLAWAYFKKNELFKGSGNLEGSEGQ